MRNKNILITGVTSGLGRELAIYLVKKGNAVFGVARRENILKDLSKELNTPNFKYLNFDLSKKGSWEKVTQALKQGSFILDVVIFNAAKIQDKTSKDLDSKVLRDFFELNFFSILNGVEVISKLGKKTHFIAISTSSAFKGSALEHIGYPSSKAALSNIFESLYLRYKKTDFAYTTIFLGPINKGSNPYQKSFFNINLNKALKIVHQAIEKKKPIYYYPKSYFFILFLIKLLPIQIYFRLLSIAEKLHHKGEIVIFQNK